jgi:hypothetical protein
MQEQKPAAARLWQNSAAEAHKMVEYYTEKGSRPVPSKIL